MLNLALLLSKPVTAARRDEHAFEADVAAPAMLLKQKEGRHALSSGGVLLNPSRNIR